MTPFIPFLEGIDVETIIAKEMENVVRIAIASQPHFLPYFRSLRKETVFDLAPMSAPSVEAAPAVTIQQTG